MMSCPCSIIRALGLVSLVCVNAVLASTSYAQDAEPAPPSEASSTLQLTDEAQQAIAQMQGEPVTALEPGQSKVLQALVIGVRGKCQWRTGDGAEWKNAQIDDLLDAGAQIRTDLRSALILRVGHNATIVVDRSTRMDLPVIVQNGDVLTTRAAIRQGRADFKVDRVGLTNDFEVITPTSTLAVRGTELGVSSGAWGSSTFGARTNAMQSIEVRYALARLRYFLSGQAKTSSEHPDPVQNAMFDTIGPPPSWTGLFESEVIEQLSLGGYLQNFDIREVRDVEMGANGLDDVQELVDFVAFENLPPPVEPEQPLSNFDLLCLYFDALFDAYFGLLETEYDGIDEQEFNELVSDIENICDNPDSFNNPFNEIRARIENFCEIITANEGTEVCVRLFTDLIDILENGEELPTNDNDPGVGQ